MIDGQYGAVHVGDRDPDGGILECDQGRARLGCEGRIPRRLVVHQPVQQRFAVLLAQRWQDAYMHHARLATEIVQDQPGLAAQALSAFREQDFEARAIRHGQQVKQPASVRVAAREALRRHSIRMHDDAGQIRHQINVARRQDQALQGRLARIQTLVGLDEVAVRLLQVEMLVKQRSQVVGVAIQLRLEVGRRHGIRGLGPSVHRRAHAGTTERILLTSLSGLKGLMK